MLNGCCACAAIQFTVEDDFAYARYCHCAGCRAATGSAFSAFGGIERAKLQVDDAVQCGVHRNADAELMHFCPTCGEFEA